jgi:hypothetical protein
VLRLDRSPASGSETSLQQKNLLKLAWMAAFAAMTFVGATVRAFAARKTAARAIFLPGGGAPRTGDMKIV